MHLALILEWTTSLSLALTWRTWSTRNSYPQAIPPWRSQISLQCTNVPPSLSLQCPINCKSVPKGVVASSDFDLHFQSQEITLKALLTLKKFKIKIKYKNIFYYCDVVGGCLTLMTVWRYLTPAPFPALTKIFLWLCHHATPSVAAFYKHGVLRSTTSTTRSEFPMECLPEVEINTIDSWRIWVEVCVKHS